MAPAFGSLMHPVISVDQPAALALSKLWNFAVTRRSAASSLFTSVLGVSSARLAVHGAASALSFIASHVIRSSRQPASDTAPASKPTAILMVPSSKGSHL